MRHPALALAPLVLVALTSCKKEEITTYKVPKEQAPATAAAKMPDDHVHAGVAKGPSTTSEPASPASAAPAATAGDRSAMANTPVATASGHALAWKGPASWQEKPASGMRKGTFTIAEGGATAELAITAFPGDVGGEVANVNRWRSQIQLAPLSPDEAVKSIQRLEANGLKIGVVEIAGSGAGATRVLGAMVPHDGSTWFFKLTGPDALVAKHKPAFMEFVKTIRPAGN